MGILEEQDRPIFIKYLELANNLKNHGFIKNYDKQVYNDLDYLYKKYINENNPHRHWCGSCRAELITYLYRWYDLQEKESPVLINQDRQGYIVDMMNLDEQSGLYEEPKNNQPKRRGRKPKQK